MPSLYILKSERDNSFYIGVTKNIKRRLKEHNKGLVRSTIARRPLELIYQEEHKTLAEAMKREKQLKSLKKRSCIEKLAGNF